MGYNNIPGAVSSPLGGAYSHPRQTLHRIPNGVDSMTREQVLVRAFTDLCVGVAARLRSVVGGGEGVR